MRRRAPGETIEPFRVRIHKRQAEQIYCGLTAWSKYASKGFTGEYPDTPSEISDRDADCWEPLYRYC